MLVRKQNAQGCGGCILNQNKAHSLLYIEVSFLILDTNRLEEIKMPCLSADLEDEPVFEPIKREHETLKQVRAHVCV